MPFHLLHSAHQELLDKQKPQAHQGDGSLIVRRSFYSASFLPHRREFSIPALSSPLPGCQTRVGVIPDVSLKAYYIATAVQCDCDLNDINYYTAGQLHSVNQESGQSGNGGKQRKSPTFLQAAAFPLLP
jgi:hypothetical protein